MSGIASKVTQLMGLSLIAYPLGFLNQILMSNYFGTSAQVDAYWIVLTIINLVGFYFGPAKEGLVPEFFKRRRADQAAGDRYFSEIGNFLLILVLLSSLALFLFPDFFASLVVDAEREQLKGLVVELLPYVIPLLFLLAATELLNGILIAFDKVILQNIGRIIGVVMSIAFLLLFARQWQIKAVIYAAVLAPFVLLIIQVRELRRAGLKYHPFSPPRADKQFRKMTGALLLAYAFSQVHAIVERNTFSHFGEGVIAAFQYAGSIHHIPQNVFILAISTVLWPVFMEVTRQQDYLQLRRLTVQACKVLLVGLGFMTVFAWLFAENIVFVLFYRGAFNATSLAWTTSSLKALVLALSPLGVSLLIGRVLVSLQRAKIIALSGIGNVLAGILVLLSGRTLGLLQISLFHITAGALVGCLVSLIAFRSILNEKKLAPSGRSSIVFWTTRLFAVDLLLLLVYPSSMFGRLVIFGEPKLDLLLKLGAHLGVLSISYLILLLLFRLVTFSELRSIRDKLKTGFFPSLPNQQ